MKTGGPLRVFRFAFLRGSLVEILCILGLRRVVRKPQGVWMSVLLGCLRKELERDFGRTA